MINKSILDGMQIKEEGFYKPVPITTSVPAEFGLLDVVGQCTVCGSPVYGKKTLLNEENPCVKRTCPCFFDNIRSRS